jgi:hypothetical protein
MSMKMNEYDQWLLRQKQDAYAMEQHQIKGATAGGNLGEQRQEQPVAAAMNQLDKNLAMLQDYIVQLDAAINTLRARLSASEPNSELKVVSTGVTHIYSTGAPDAIQYDKDGNEMAHWKFRSFAPPQREWQGLTDEEVGMLTVFDGLHHVEIPLLASFARAIEGKLKEKNA